MQTTLLYSLSIKTAIPAEDKQQMIAKYMKLKQRVRYLIYVLFKRSVAYVCEWQGGTFTSGSTPQKRVGEQMLELKEIK